MSDEMMTRVLSSLDRLEGAVGDLKSDIVGIKSDIVGIKSDIVGIKSEMTGMRSDMTSMRSDMTSMRSDMTGLRSEMSDLRSDVRRHEDALTRLQAGLDELRAGFKHLAADQASLRAEISIRTDRVLDSITAFRDDITVTYARSDQIGRTVEGVRIEMRSSHQTILAHLVQLHSQNDAVVNEMQGMNALVSRIEHQTLRMQSTMAALRRDGGSSPSATPH